MALNIEYAKRRIKCNCGHYAKSHFYKEGQCSECGCTWYWPNDRWLKKHKENGMKKLENQIHGLRCTTCGKLLFYGAIIYRDTKDGDKPYCVWCGAKKK